VFGPFVELVKSLNLPDWLVHWGHPGNMVCIYIYFVFQTSFFIHSHFHWVVIDEGFEIELGCEGRRM